MVIGLTQNVFENDAFSVISLTNFINKEPYRPGRVQSLGLFKPEPLSTTIAMIEENDGILEIIPTSQRGAPAPKLQGEKRKARALEVPQIKQEDTIYAHSLQNVRSFGGIGLQTIQMEVQRRMRRHNANIEATVENLMLGALKGEILDADGSTVIYNLFDEFQVTQETAVNFALTTDTTDVRGICQTVRRTMKGNLGNYASGKFTIRAFCGDNFFDALISHSDVKTAYERYQNGAALRDDFTESIFQFGGIMFENYYGGDLVSVSTDECILFPEIPEIYSIYYSPGDFLDMVNTPGLPKYARVAYDQEFNRWSKTHAQSNPLPVCLIPKVLMKGSKA